jgi:membrane-associated phospholipid phosphatase
MPRDWGWLSAIENRGKGMAQVVEQEARIAPLASPRERTAASDGVRRMLACAGGLFLLSGAALAVDLPVAQWFKEHELAGEFRRLVHLSEAFAWGGTVALIILAAALLDPRGWRVAGWLAAVTLGAGILANVLKLMVARLRPSAANLDGNVLETFVAWLPLAQGEVLAEQYGYKLQSFPSGHAATAAALAIGLATLYCRGAWLFAAVAVLAAVQRLEGDAHFLSDVLAGGAVACLAAALCHAAAPLRRWRRPLGDTCS